MLSALKNLRIGHRVLIAAGVPFLCLVAVLAFVGLEHNDTRRQALAAADLAGQTPAVSDLVHALQRERGLSVGFLANRSEVFRDRLTTQRHDTRAAVDGLPEVGSDSRLAGPLQQAQTKLGALAILRGKVDAGSVTPGDAASGYSEIIRANIEALSTLRAATKRTAQAGMTEAYLALVEAKERAGIERAVGAAGFGSGFSPELHTRFVRLGAEQQSYLTQFRATAAESFVTDLEALRNGPRFDEVRKFREQAVQAGYESTNEVDPASWFTAASDRIDDLRGLEKDVVQAIAGATGELAASKARSVWLTVGIAILLLAATGAISVLVLRSVVRPLGTVTTAIQKLSAGDTSTEVPETGRGDEIGDVARATEIFREAVIQQQAHQQEEQRRQAAEAERAQRLRKLIEAFEGSVAKVVSTVTAASTELNTTAESLSATAEQAGQQAQAVSAAAEQASTNVQTVSSAASELATSVEDINRQVATTSRMAGAARQQAKRTNERVEGLDAAAQKIGSVVEIISDIAEQTNLLALNATIEAARAGEAGKGFAVVAQEVKTLASQTARATEDIQNQVGAIQSETQAAVAAIREITGTIEQIDEIAQSVAAAVEEQGAATKEIARSVDEAATGTQEVTSNIAGVSAAASETGGGAHEVLSAASQLSKESSRLEQEVGGFLDGVRAA